jgi:hypothetical protein
MTSQHHACRHQTIYSSDIEDDDNGVTEANPIPILFPLTSPTTPTHARARALSLPPMSSDGIIASSPIVGTREQRTAIARNKGLRKRKVTMAEKRVEEEARKAEILAESSRQAEESEAAKMHALDEVLSSLALKGLSLGDVMTYVFDPKFRQGTHRWEGFFKRSGTATRILDHWVSPRNSPSARTEVHEWAVNYVAKVINDEAKAVNDQGFLRSEKKTLTASHILGFSIVNLQKRLRQTAGVAMKMFDSFATSSRHLRPGNISAARWLKKSTVSSECLPFCS